MFSIKYYNLNKFINNLDHLFGAFWIEPACANRRVDFLWYFSAELESFALGHLESSQDFQNKKEQQLPEAHCSSPSSRGLWSNVEELGAEWRGSRVTPVASVSVGQLVFTFALSHTLLHWHLVPLRSADGAVTTGNIRRLSSSLRSRCL